MEIKRCLLAVLWGLARLGELLPPKKAQDPIKDGVSSAGTLHGKEFRGSKSLLPEGD